ncbi:hypothetical protein MAAFP003_2960 [Mycobacterium ahvazicum]|uniref:Uncharacterized protein n=1 Tax=Mycobacterium ahvazicum TaxID=1964395 RepID=A0A2K4YBY5_9MYCO|nr:hypothetical protein [Mycobacterium ahvazicum]SOX54284.1 hypothetical protein MAAFP003_2960 [Mycobacterium ahvazicum]
MSWFQRAKKTVAGQRVTRSDQQHAIDAVAELNELGADGEPLMRDGLLDVQLPAHDTYRATRRISLGPNSTS